MSFGVYVHYPYCAKVCPYCDFNVVARRQIPHARYTDAVLAELQLRGPRFLDRGELVSIYFGGGTPGLWPPGQIARVVDALGSYFNVCSAVEISLELNPENATLSGLKSLREAGFNRLSLGAQSFDRRLLNQLGRQHSESDIERALEWAACGGFDNINIDLIHGYFGQGIGDALADIDKAIACGVQHISTYQLTIEKKTIFGHRIQKGAQLLDSESTLLDMFHGIRKHLLARGYPPYELCSASLPRYRSQHGLGYWTGRDYLALGAGGHGFYRRASGGAVRWGNERSPERYMESALAGQLVDEFHETSNERELHEELLMMGLRLEDGLKPTPSMKAYFADNAARCERLGLIQRVDDRWAVSDRGRDILDSVIVEMIS